MKFVYLVSALASLCLLPAAAAAQEQPVQSSAPAAQPTSDQDSAAPSQGPDTDNDGADEEVPEGEDTSAPNNGYLPPPKSDKDTAPPVATPGTPAGKVVQQAGVGGQTGYGRAGVLELGGSAGLTAASDFTQANVQPSLGWFVADNLELSGLLGFSYISAENNSATMASVLVEPSYHLPFSRKAFAFLGVGMGGSHVENAGFGFSVAPRLGANFLVGRSGLLTPSLSYQYTTTDTMQTDAGTLLVVKPAVQANIGYTVMW